MSQGFSISINSSLILSLLMTIFLLKSDYREPWRRTPVRYVIHGHTVLCNLPLLDDNQKQMWGFHWLATSPFGNLWKTEPRTHTCFSSVLPVCVAEPCHMGRPHALFMTLINIYEPPVKLSGFEKLIDEKKMYFTPICAVVATCNFYMPDFQAQEFKFSFLKILLLKTEKEKTKHENPVPGCKGK